MPSFIEPRRTSENAFAATVQEANVNGVSTRSVDKIVQAMGASGVSKSQVSRLCEEIDERVSAFRAQPLEGNSQVRQFPANFRVFFCPPVQAQQGFQRFDRGIFRRWRSIKKFLRFSLAGKPWTRYFRGHAHANAKAGGHQCPRSVESCRNESGKPRVRVVADLGRPDKIRKTKKIDPPINGPARAAGRARTDDGDIVHELAAERGRFSPSTGSGASWGSTKACAARCGPADASSTPRS